MLFKKNDSANLVSKSTKSVLKKSSPENEKAQNVVFNLKGRIPLSFYCVKTYLKLRNIHFKQIAKTRPLGKTLP